MSILGALPWRANGRRVLDADGNEICEIYQTVSRPSVHDCMTLAQAIAALPTSRDTERTKIAALVMQGLLANPDRSDASDDRVARWAVNAADSLLNALNAEPQS